MTEATHEPIWDAFLAEWGLWIPELFLTADTLSSVTGKVPDEWLTAARQPGQDSIAALWRSAADNLPRFSEYLANEILQVAIGKGDIGFVLIYFLRACVERPVGVYHPGFLFGGVPLHQPALADFESEHGRVPASLASLWRVHSFIRTKDDSTVASLDPASHPLVAAPRCLPGLFHTPDDGRTIRECLAVVDPGLSSSLCVTRRPGANAWDDHVVRVFSHDDTYVPTAWATLDDLLTDWERSDYRPTRPVRR